MGRAKRRMELINNEKARYATFQKRKKGLEKKTYELKTLCDVEVCLIIYRPKMDEHPTEPEIWPPNPDVIQQSIETNLTKIVRRGPLFCPTSSRNGAKRSRKL
ncbi:hypothetical protein U1Q18_017390 [Sarracenia purpurea var. burkii]